MPQFSDDLFLGSAQTYMGINTYSNLGDPAPMDIGVGPLGRIYVWDTVPATKQAASLAASQTPTGAGNLTLTAGTSVTSVINASGSTVYQLDVPRVVSVTQVAAGTQRTFTVSGFDYYGQAMSEAITSTVGATVNGKKAFWQISSVAVSGATTTACTVGTGDVFGCPVKFSNLGYIARMGWNNVLAEDVATVVVGDSTTASTTTGDVRGTVAPSSSADGAKRLVVGVLMTAIQVGPNATRSGALGVDQA